MRKLIILTFLIAAVASRAQDIKVTTSGTITKIFQTSTFWDSSIVSGVPFTAVYYFGAQPTDQNSSTSVGEFRHTAPAAVVVSVGNYQFVAGASFAGVHKNAPALLAPGDQLIFKADGNFTSSGVTFSNSGLTSNLISLSNSVFLSDAFPLSAPSVSGFTYDLSFEIYGTFGDGGTVHLLGPITGFSVMTVPESSTPASLFLGSCLLLGYVAHRMRGPNKAPEPTTTSVTSPAIVR